MGCTDCSRGNRLEKEMTDWSNWKEKKKELRDKLKKAMNLIYHCEIIEARDVIQSVADEMTEVIELTVDQHS